MTTEDKNKVMNYQDEPREVELKKLERQLIFLCCFLSVLIVGFTVYLIYSFIS